MTTKRNELRCTGKLHGLLRDDDTLEVKCRSKWCGAEAGVVVLHRFDAHTGELKETLRFSEPNRSGDG